VLAGIGLEREVVEPLRQRADRVIDTSSLSVHELAREIERLVDPRGPDEFTISVRSFGFKYGVPLDANHLLDVRFLANPYWIDELRHLNGLDQRVRGYVLSLPGAKTIVERYVATIGVILDGPARERHPRLSIAVGCTGGKHRSVVVAEALAARLAGHGRITTFHRDLGRE
jgi:UPF0042 nucleotide-binding protein